MAEVEVHRRLVKSPPELWAELSDVEGLARHLGEFGEIRITRTDPETTVAWEGERARGTVEIEPSGWGTKVTLSAEPLGGDEAGTEEAKASADPGPDAGPVAKDDPPKPDHEPGAKRESGPVAKQDTDPIASPIAKRGPQAIAKPVANRGPEPIAKPDPEPVAKEDPGRVAKPIADRGAVPVTKPDPEPIAEKHEERATPDPVPTPVAAPPKKVGFFARLFRRRKHAPPVAAEPDPGPVPVPEEGPDPKPEPAAEPEPEPAVQAKPEPKTEATSAPSVGTGHEPEADATAASSGDATSEPEAGRDPKWVVNADPERLVKRDSVVEPENKPEPVVEVADVPEVEPVTKADVPEVEPVVTDERAIAVLTAALDALGSAHHRPFSRG